MVIRLTSRVFVIFLLDGFDRGVGKLARDVVCERWDALVVR